MCGRVTFKIVGQCSSALIQNLFVYSEVLLFVAIFLLLLLLLVLLVY